MIFIKKIIDYIDQNISDFNDYIYLNINYMHRAIKSIQVINDKIILESNFSMDKKFLSAEQVLEKLYNIRNLQLPIWLKISIHKNMFKPLNYINIKQNKINLYFDFDPQIDIDPIIDENNINEDEIDEINENNMNDENNIDEIDNEKGSDEFD